MTYFNKFNTISNDLIYAIIGVDEYLHAYNNDWIDKDNLCLISIHYPYANVHPDTKIQGFADVLQVKFWDTEHDSERTPVISHEIANEIREFIINNKDKRFLIHCTAGKSRSAGVGLAVECLINFEGDVYGFMTGYSDVKENPRYTPNRAVFDRIVKGI
jgi:predicted protein tyrosine phosphatase